MNDNDMCCGGTRTRKGCEYHDPASQWQHPTQTNYAMADLGRACDEVLAASLSPLVPGCRPEAWAKALAERSAQTDYARVKALSTGGIPEWAKALDDRSANAREIDQAVNIGGVMFLLDEFVGVASTLDDEPTSGFLVATVLDGSSVALKLAAMFAADSVCRLAPRLMLSAPGLGVDTDWGWFLSKDAAATGDLTTYTLRFMRNQTGAP